MLFSRGIIPSVEPLILCTKTAPISHKNNNPIKIRICGILRYVSLLALLRFANFNSILDWNFLRSLDLKHFLNRITKLIKNLLQLESQIQIRILALNQDGV